MRATQALRTRGVAIRHEHVATHKPFDAEAVLEAVAASRSGVITMENHVITGGLGSAVAEVIAESGIGKRLVRIGLRDTFVHGASRPYLMKEYGLDAAALVREVEKTARCRLRHQRVRSRRSPHRGRPQRGQSGGAITVARSELQAKGVLVRVGLTPRPSLEA